MNYEQQYISPDADAAMMSGNVLVVEDDAGVSDVLSMALEMEGHRVTVAPSVELGKKAVQAAFEQGALFDFIAFDHDIIGGFGEEIAREHSQLEKAAGKSHAYYVGISGEHNPTAEEIDLSPDEADHLDFKQKPFDLEEIINATQAAVVRRRQLAA